MPLNNLSTFKAALDAGAIFVEDNSATVDNVFVFNDGFNKVRLVPNGDYRASWAGVGIASQVGIDKTSILNTILSNSAVNTVIFDNNQNITISGSLTIPSGKNISFKKGSKFVGTGVININGTIKDTKDIQIFDPSLSLTINTGTNTEWYPEWFGAINTTDTTTDSTLAFKKLISCLPTTYSQTNTKVTIVLTGNYNVSDQLYFRNKNFNIKGRGQLNGSGITAIGNFASTVTRAAIAEGETYSFNADTLNGTGVDYIQVTMSGVTTNTTIAYVIVPDEHNGGQVLMGTFRYTGSNSFVVLNHRPSHRESIYFLDAPHANNVTELSYSGLGSTAGTYYIRNSVTGGTITSLKIGGVETLSSNLFSGSTTSTTAHLYGIMAPYSVKVTFTGVTNGTTIYYRRHNVDLNTSASSGSFTYTGADTVVMTGFNPNYYTNMAIKDTMNFIFGISAPSGNAGQEIPFGAGIGVTNTINGSTITSFKLNDVEQMSKYLWQGKSVIATSGCDRPVLQDMSINSYGVANPLQMPYAGYSMFNNNSLGASFLTQREHNLINVSFGSWGNNQGGDYNKFRAFKHGFIINGSWANNDFCNIDHCIFSTCQSGYTNYCQQAVEHSIRECQWKMVDDAVTVLTGSIAFYKPFLEFGIGRGFLNIVGDASNAINFSCIQPSTEGIQGWYWIMARNGCAINGKFISAQPVFWNTLGNSNREPYLIWSNSNAISQLEWDATNAIIGNFSANGTIGPVKISMRDNFNISKLKLKSTFSVINGISSVSLVNGTSIMLDMDITRYSVGNPYQHQTFRNRVTYNDDFWRAYKTSISAVNVRHMPISFLFDSPDTAKFTSGTRAISVGRSDSPQYELGTDNFIFNVSAPTANPVIIPNKLTANKLIKTVTMKTLALNIVNETSTFDPTQSSTATIKIGDRYNPDRWGWIDATNNNVKSIGNISPVTYDISESIVLTPVYVFNPNIRGGTAKIIGITGGVFILNAVLVSAFATALIGRSIKITEGPYNGIQGNITAVTPGGSTTTITTDLTSLTVTGDTFVEIQGRMVNVSGGISLLTVYSDEANVNSQQFLAFALPSVASITITP